MKKRIRYANEPMGKPKVVKDFLPSPEQLSMREDKVKVTISLSKSSVDYFKMVAKESKTPHQKMIRHVLDYYASQFQQPLSGGSTRSRVRRAG
jgi:hypothetical protein